VARPHPASGVRPGSDGAFLRRQPIDKDGHAHCVLPPRAFCNLQPDPDFGTAIAAADNDGLADSRHSAGHPDGEFKGSITANIQDPGAARELGRHLRRPSWSLYRRMTTAAPPATRRAEDPLGW